MEQIISFPSSLDIIKWCIFGSNKTQAKQIVSDEAICRTWNDKTKNNVCQKIKQLIYSESIILMVSENFSTCNVHLHILQKVLGKNNMNNLSLGKKTIETFLGHTKSLRKTKLALIFHLHQRIVSMPSSYSKSNWWSLHSNWSGQDWRGENFSGNFFVLILNFENFMNCS